MKKKIIYIVLVIIFILFLIIASVMMNKKSNEKLNTDISNVIELNNMNNIENSNNNSQPNEETKIKEVFYDNFEKEVLKNDKPVLVDFYATWCGPCKYLSPIIEEIAKENNSIKVVKVNVDSEQKLAEKYMISSMPTVVLFKDGEEINRFSGALPKKLIEKFISENINK